MKLNRVAVAAGLLASVVGLAACGSDSTGAGGGSGAKTSTGTGTANATDASCESGTLKADGSTAQQNAMTQWIKDYQSKCPGANISYGGVGSGQGITDFTAGQVDFAGSDAALDPSLGQVAAATKNCGSQAVDIPMVTGPISVSYNLPGVKKLILTPNVVAGIMLGKIKTWNDPAITAINKGVSLPSQHITVFNRSDQSGTTQNFESYLQASAPSVWKAAPSKIWAGVGQGKAGNPLLGQAVQSTTYSIGYVEWSYAIENNLSEAEIDNGAGAVALTSDSVAKTVDTAQVSPSGPGDLSLKLDYATKTAGAYPIVLVTYEVVCSKYKSSTTGAFVKSFLTFTSSSAEQDAVHNLGYAPLPTGVQSKVQAEIAKIS